MNGLVPASWGTLLCMQDGKYNPFGEHQLRPEREQLLLRYEPNAAKSVSESISSIRKEQRWKIK